MCSTPTILRYIIDFLVSKTSFKVEPVRNYQLVPDQLETINGLNLFLKTFGVDNLHLIKMNSIKCIVEKIIKSEQISYIKVFRSSYYPCSVHM